jgi:hypothetical protein
MPERAAATTIRPDSAATQTESLLLGEQGAVALSAKRAKLGLNGTRY